MKEDANPLKRIEHIVVVMLENRSFDSLLGWLYDPANEAPFDIVPSDFEGLSGKRLSNPDLSGKEVPAGKTLDLRSPQPNPGEPFEDVYSQIYDVPLMPFSEVPAVPTKAATMRGFIRNYADQKHKPIDPSTIMQSLTPQTVHGIIGNLERAGLIVRFAHPVHGRVRMIALSKSGRVLLARCKERAVKADAQLNTGISPAEEVVIRRWLVGLATRAE